MSEEETSRSVVSSDLYSVSSAKSVLDQPVIFS